MKFIAIAICCMLMSASAFSQVKLDTYGFVLATYSMAKNVDVPYRPFRADETPSVTKDKTLNQISIQDSRFGFKMQQGKNLTAKIEFDFNAEVGRNKAGAAGGDNLAFRNRIASISYTNGNGTINIGKMWTQYTGVNPFTYHATTVNLTSGNTGFLVDAVQYTHKFGKFRVGVETTTGGSNPASELADPNIGLRIDYKTKKFLVGLAHKRGTVALGEADTNERNYEVAATKLFFQGNITEKTAIKGEYYMAQNGGNVAGTIGSYGAADSAQEAGFYLSAKHSFEKLGIFGGYGTTSITNFDDVKSVNNIDTNTVINFGLDYKLEENLLTFVEHSIFKTKYENREDDGVSTHIGMKYSF